MILDVINFIEGIILLLFPIYLVYVVFKNILQHITDESYWQHLKTLFCTFVSAAIFMTILVVMSLDYIQLALLFKDKEIDEVALNIMFLVVTFIWQVIGISLLHLIWKNIANKQIIPGTGNVRFRIKKKWILLKRSIKDARRKKDISNNSS